MRVFALLHGIAAVVRGVHQLGRQTGVHRVLRTATGGGDQPADRERLGALRTNLDRNLVGRTADAAAADLDARLHVGKRIVEHLDRIALGARFDHVESGIDDAFGDGLLAVQHDRIHELGENDITELRVRQDLALLGATTTGHLCLPSDLSVRGALPNYFGRFAPYLERD